MINRRTFSFGVVSTGAISAAPASVFSQASWPQGRVSIVVPFPAGAATDITGRIVAEKLTQIWGQPVIIENKGGGNGLPAAEYVARARPDGLTILLTSAMTHAVNPALYEKLPYHPINDFEAVSQLGRLPFVVLVPSDSKLKTLSDLTALLKAEPTKHNFGAGSLPARVASELYKQLAGVDALHIGYRSNPQAFPDLLSGRLTFMTIDTTNGRIQIDGGKMRGLAITLPQRDLKLPQVPSTTEAGIPELILSTWTGFYVPKGTPKDIVNRLNRDIVAACNDAQLITRFESMGGKPVTSSPEEFTAFTRSEIDRWEKIIRSANIKLD